MNKIKHTPGPWTTALYDVTDTMRERLKHKQFAVCRDDKQEDSTGELVAICGDFDPKEPENNTMSLGDAYLIAAAPDMYEALKSAYKHYRCMYDEPYLAGHPTFQRIVIALAKAEGITF